MRTKKKASASVDIRSYFKKFDKATVFFAMALSVCGLVAIMSSVVADSSKARCLPVQIGGIALGIVAMLIISKIDYELICDLWIFIIIFSSAALLFTAIFADNQGGNYNWITIAGINIQTSEFTKIAFVITISTHIMRLGDRLNKPLSILILGAHFMMYFIPVVLQHDLGSSLIYIGIFVTLLFIAGVNLRYFAAGITLIAAAAPIIWEYLRTDQKKRIIYGFQPELDPLGYGYQPLVAKMALGSGQMSGLGYGQGIQTQNSLLPANHTDFVYAIIGEEFGFVGCMIVLVLMVLLVISIFANLKRINSVNGRLICVGIASIVIYQTLINLGMVLGLSPVIGVTLPFVSYGGSSILSLFIALGVLQSVRIKESTEKTLRFGENK